jgi:2-deoxy-D-gluconate 3-dehydrogenase
MTLMSGLFDLTGKSALVTGASTGLGRGMTLALASAGADIALVDHVPRGIVAEEVRKAGRKAFSLTLDLSERGAAARAVEAAVGEFGKVDIAVNNAGIIRRINITSLLAFQGGILVPSYAASKGAVAQLTKALANEWAPFGINVNAIAPGYMATDNTRALREDPVRSKAIVDRIPAGRWGQPEDIGGAAVFLASAASDYVHGHVLVVDGGWLAR